MEWGVVVFTGYGEGIGCYCTLSRGFLCGIHMGRGWGSWKFGVG